MMKSKIYNLYFKKKPLKVNFYAQIYHRHEENVQKSYLSQKSPFFKHESEEENMNMQQKPFKISTCLENCRVY